MKKDLKEALNNNFANMDLRGWSFKGQNLSGANFTGANLEGACFIDAILVSTNFEGARLAHADFSCANAWGANFNETNCKDALFLSANLTEASFEGADVAEASFAQANLSNASLEDAQNIITAEFDNTVGIYPVCPDTGSFTAWTIGEDEEGNEYLVEILLPWTALRNSGTTRRCRANAMYINGITQIGESLEDDECPNSVKLKNRDFKLNLGESAIDENFEVDRFKVSSTDLYFYITEEEALEQARKRI